MGQTSERLLRIEEVMQITGLPKSTIYNKIHKGTFPKPYRVGPRSVRWKESEIIDWMNRLPRATNRQLG